MYYPALSFRNGYERYRITTVNSLDGILNLEFKTRILSGLDHITNTLNNSFRIRVFTHLQRNLHKSLFTQLGTKHIGKLLIICRFRGNRGRSIGLLLIASNKCESAGSKHEKFRLHFFRLLGIETKKALCQFSSDKIVIFNPKYLEPNTKLAIFCPELKAYGLKRINNETLQVFLCNAP